MWVWPSTRSTSVGTSQISKASTISTKQFAKLWYCHGIPPRSIMVPSPTERAQTPPYFHLSISCYHCYYGAMPQLADYYLRIVYHVGVAPHQLAPNTYLILAGLRRLFDFVLGKVPTITEILYLYKYKTARNPNFYFLEANFFFLLRFWNINQMLATTKNDIFSWGMTLASIGISISLVSY